MMGNRGWPSTRNNRYLEGFILKLSSGKGCKKPNDGGSELSMLKLTAGQPNRIDNSE